MDFEARAAVSGAAAHCIELIRLRRAGNHNTGPRLAVSVIA